MIKMKLKFLDMSGMGGKYEEMCRRMLIDGLSFIDKYKLRNLMLILYKQKLLGELEKTLVQVVTERDKTVTGAMVNVVVSHIFYIAINGYNEWIEMGGDDDVIEIDVNRETHSLFIHKFGKSLLGNKDN